jgi:hypothetical protein
VASSLTEVAGCLFERVACETLLSSFVVPPKFCRSSFKAILGGSEPASSDGAIPGAVAEFTSSASKLLWTSLHNAANEYLGLIERTESGCPRA